MICCNGLLQMILNFLSDALRHRKTQRRRERLRIPEITPSGAAARPQEGLLWHLKTAARRPGAGKSLLARRVNA
jgi:hypothetical protein